MSELHWELLNQLDLLTDRLTCSSYSDITSSLWGCWGWKKYSTDLKDFFVTLIIITTTTRVAEFTPMWRSVPTDCKFTEDYLDSALVSWRWGVSLQPHTDQQYWLRPLNIIFLVSAHLHPVVEKFKTLFILLLGAFQRVSAYFCLVIPRLQTLRK